LADDKDFLGRTKAGESIWRDRMWADAMLAQRDPTQPLQ
jgi:hypothetical protein